MIFIHRLEKVTPVMHLISYRMSVEENGLIVYSQQGFKLCRNVEGLEKHCKGRESC